MKKWKLTYELQILFSSPVSHHFYSLRCLPQHRQTQDILTCSCRIEPCPHFQSRRMDSFGNQLLYGKIEKDSLFFRASVTAVAAVYMPMETEIKDYIQLGMYRCHTVRTMAGERIKTFADAQKSNLKSAVTPWERTEAWMEVLWNHFAYQSGSTDINTTAEDAFKSGYGVCQDYAQILLALLREDGITARYAAGTVPGEGETHAWVETWQDGNWKGFDPTNNRVMDESCLVFAVGRDAWDCALNKGVFLGNARQAKKVYVKMEEG